VTVESRGRRSGTNRARMRPLTVALGLRSVGWFVFAVLQLRGLITSIYGYHSLRQTQTAISIREMLRGGPLLRYETPIFGPPWSIPLEFPLYQWICAAAVKLFGTSIDGTARVVSAIFGAGCVVALTRIHRVLGRPESERHLLGAMAALSPVMLFWSHTVLIETCSVFFTLLWLELALRWMLQPAANRIWIVLGAIAVGFLAGATKGTSVVPGLVFVALLLLARLRKRWSELRSSQTRRSFIVEHFGAGIVMLAPVAGAGWWTRTAEKIRLLNPRGPGEIRRQIFGTWAERKELGVLGRATVRTLGNTVGSTWVVIVVGVAVLFACVRFRRSESIAQSSTMLSSGVLAFSSLFTFVVTPLALFHVHVVHDYYTVELAPFLILAIVFGLSVVRERVPASWAVLPNAVIPILVVVTSFVTYSRFYEPKDTQQVVYDPGMKAAVERALGPNDVIIVRNTGYDPSIGYHVDRKIVTQFESKDVVDLGKEFGRLDAAGYRSGVIQCGPIPERVKRYLERSGREQLGVWHGCTLFGLPKPLT
jgi:4-amino-4-deoxy-L-arabinose transferase-like glycosyltransferase